MGRQKEKATLGELLPDVVFFTWKLFLKILFFKILMSNLLMGRLFL